jgi:hypothetical protein
LRVILTAMQGARFDAEFFCRPGEQTASPEMTARCASWDEALKSATEVANADRTVIGVRIEFDNGERTWAKTSEGWVEVRV